MTKPRLTHSQLLTADALWKKGKRTDQIAEWLGVSEAAVFNSLYLLREVRRAARERVMA